MRFFIFLSPHMFRGPSNFHCFLSRFPIQSLSSSGRKFVVRYRATRVGKLRYHTFLTNIQQVWLCCRRYFSVKWWSSIQNNRPEGENLLFQRDQFIKLRFQKLFSPFVVICEQNISRMLSGKFIICATEVNFKI